MGKGTGLKFDGGAKTAGLIHSQGGMLPIEFIGNADLVKLLKEDLEVGYVDLLNQEFRPGGRGGDGQGAGLNAIRDDPIAWWRRESLYPPDVEGVGVFALDLGAGEVEEADQVADVRLGSGQADRSLTVGESGGQDRVLSSGDGELG